MYNLITRKPAYTWIRYVYTYFYAGFTTVEMESKVGNPAAARSPLKIKTFYDFSARTLIKKELVDFKEYEGKVILVMNVASL